jgi:type I restriction enzyme S subunit
MSRLPSGWRLELLDGVAKRGSGHTPDKKRPEYWGGDVKWVSLQDSARLDNGYIEETAESISELGIRNSSAVLHPAETVVLSRDAGVGKSAVMRSPMAVSQHFMAWQCGTNLDRWYLYYWLQSQKAEFERIANGNTIKTIGVPYFKALRLPIPGIDEQRLIASTLLDIDNLLRKYDLLISKKFNVRQTMLQQLLSGVIRMNEGGSVWQVKCLGEMFSFSGGHTASRNQLGTEGSLYLHYGDIHKTDKSYVDVECQLMDIPRLDISMDAIGSGSILKDGDVVFVDASEDEDGVSRYVVVCNPKERPFISGLHTIVAKARRYDLDNKFKRYCFQSAAVKTQFRYFAAGTKVSGVSRRNLAKIEIRVPPIDEQALIAQVLCDMDAELSAIGLRREKALQIKKGMMQELLTGRIRLV